MMNLVWFGDVDVNESRSRSVHVCFQCEDRSLVTDELWVHVYRLYQ